MTTATDAHTYQSTVLLFSSLHCGRPCVMPTTVTVTNNNSAAISASLETLVSRHERTACRVHIHLIGRYITPLPFTSRGGGNWSSPRPFHSWSHFQLPASYRRSAGGAVRLSTSPVANVDEVALSYHSIDAPQLHHTLYMWLQCKMSRHSNTVTGCL